MLVNSKKLKTPALNLQNGKIGVRLLVIKNTLKRRNYWLKRLSESELNVY